MHALVWMFLQSPQHMLQFSCNVFAQCKEICKGCVNAIKVNREKNNSHEQMEMSSRQWEFKVKPHLLKMNVTTTT